MDRNYKVYVLTLNDGRVYIGMTRQTLRNRCRKGGYKEGTNIGDAINEYGMDAFKVGVIAENLTKSEAELVEKEMIAAYDSTNPDKGFNIALGGNIVGRHSIITRQKMSVGQKGRKFSEEHLSKLRKPKSKVTPRSKPPVCKHVLQYDIDGNFLREFESASAAANSVGGWTESIRRCCNHLQRTCAGYKWEYERRYSENDKRRIRDF
jgi:predicted GIY-YIG superfamily endonuclease